MSQPRSGSLPADFENTVASIIREVGVATLTKKILRQRLQAKYGMDFASHDDKLTETLHKLMQTSEFQKELLKAKSNKKSSGNASKSAPAKSKRGSGTDKAQKKEKRARHEKKPDNYPKAALSAYIMFGNDQRAKILKENPSLKITEVSKKIGDLWKNASQTTKEQYSKRAESEKKRFEKEMTAYTAKGGEIYKRRSKKEKRSRKDPNAPKRALSGYIFFAQDFRSKHSNMNITEQMSKAGEAWRAMNDSEKAPYEQKAAKDKQRYEKECRSFGKH